MIAALAFAAAVLAQASAAPLTTPAPSTLPAPQHLATIRLGAPRASLTVQVARSAPERERGLMSVTRLGAHTGMLFVFPAESVWSFWMKDTLLDLDMIWVRKDGTVTRVAVRVPHSAPDTPDELIATRDGLGAYVIELPAGEAVDDGLALGSRVTGLPPLSQI